MLVIDEAQDMGVEEHALVRALMHHNEEMRVIAVGDDDQNIYEFRGSDSGYMWQLTQEAGSRFVEMTENYRSARHVVAAANDFVKGIGGRLKSMPIVSIRKEDGWVGVTRHQSACMYQPLVEELLRNRGEGTACVLTQTNEEAVILVALLRKRGVRSKLIQSMEGLLFWNMAEMRYFLKYIGKQVSTPLIPDELWEKAKGATFAAYEGSLGLPYVRRCVELFEEINRMKYFTDFKEFVFESSMEDFVMCRGLMWWYQPFTRQRAVSLTTCTCLFRTSSQGCASDAPVLCGHYPCQKRLFVHTNGDCFANLKADQYLVDSREYAMPGEIVLQLSHKDVFLGFLRTSNGRCCR